MNKSEYLFQKFQEECMEAAQRASKINTFGLYETQEGQDLNNEDRFLIEYIDLLATMELMVEEKIISSISKQYYLFEKIDAKKTKIKKFMEYSREKGCLQ